MPKSAGKRLIIAEKATAAKDIAGAIGKIPKNEDVFENDEFVISYAVGHLVELCLPGEMDKVRGKWSFASLPVIPERFELKVIEKNAGRLNALRRLIRRSDVVEIINACDAGREGELIFHNIMRITGTQKPTRRLWMQSMTPEAIRQGFAALRSAAEMVPLAEAAVCRSESDWLVGINSTRAMTAFNSRGGGFQLTPVGRVQTPTLAILAARELQIRDFKPRDYFEVHAEFGVASGSYQGRWFDENFQKSADENARAERIWDREAAEALVQKCAGHPGQVSEEKKPTTQIAPQLYDLTSLQREANGRFGLPASRTLKIAQSLYEKHKVLTYPRTDSRHLPEDYPSTVKATLGKLQEGDLATHAAHVLKNGWVRPNRRIFNNAKVTDHFAIIPTGVSPKNLDDFEMRVFDMVARRFVAAFFPEARFEVTTRITRVCGEPFRSDGKVITDPGWLAVYGKSAPVSGDTQTLCAVQTGESASTESIEIKENQTRPPARYNEGTLLTAMETAGKLVDDEDLREAMSARGLGTPATRARIIDGLLGDGYLLRQGRDLIVAQKGLSLISLLRGIGAELLTSPEMTGEWEHKLKRMEAGEFPRGQFMEQIQSLTRDIVDKAKNFGDGSVEGQFMDLEVKCPKCGSVGFKESYKAYECRGGCGLLIWKNMAGRELEREEVTALLTEKRVGPLEGFRSKLGRPFAAPVILDEEFKQKFDFGEPKDTPGAQLDFSTLPVIAEKCPVCAQGAIHDAGTAYVCSNTPACKFRMGKSLCQYEVPHEQVLKLIETGKTDLITRFISKKGRPFSAFLKIEDGRVGFEFEPREASSSKPGARKSPAKAGSGWRRKPAAKE